MRFEKAPRWIGCIFDKITFRAISIEGFIGIIAGFKQLPLWIVIIFHTAVQVAIFVEETRLAEITFSVKLFLEVFEVSDFIYCI